MRVRVLYFGMLKDLLSRSSEEIELQSGCTVSGLRQAYQDRIPERAWAAMAVAVNQEYAGNDLVLGEGDEIALLPPVSGGIDTGFPSPPSKISSDAGRDCSSED